MTRFVAVDWGTTNRRLYVLEGHRVIFARRDGRGVLDVGAGGFDAEIDRLRSECGEAPMLLTGMVGSNRGWMDAGYVPTPATLADLAGASVPARGDIVIVPGVSHICGRGGDVMRGEEVQMLGAIAAGLAPRDGLLCQPGTHCKWATVRDGALVSFITAMTGEMFALLKAHAMVGAEMSGEVADNAAFAEGVADSGRNDLLSAIFSVRPASLLGLRAAQDGAAYISGLLVGADVRAHRQGQGPVHVIAEPMLGGLYVRAIGLTGGEARLVDSEAAFVAGAGRIQEALPCRG